MSIFPSSMPYDDVTIIDQSGYVEETVTETPYIPSGPIAFMPFISPRGYGEDNKLMYMNGSKLAKYGNPNLKKYGLSLYLAKRFIEGGGTVLGMRVVPDTFTHAYACIAADVSKATQCKYTALTNSINGKITYYPYFSDGNNEYMFDELYMKKTSDIDTISYVLNGVEKSLPELIESKSGEPATPATKITVNSAGITYTGTLAKTENVVTFTTSGESSKTFTLVTGNALTVKYKKVILGEESTSIDVIKSKFKDSASGITEELKNAKYVLDENDSVTIPLFVVASKGAGKYGNGFKFRIAIDSTQNAAIKTAGESEFCYRFIDSDNNAKLDNPITFSFNDDYMYQNESMCIDEVFDAHTENVTMFKMDDFDTFIKIVEANCCSSDNIKHTITNVNQVDILFGSNMNSDVYYVNTDDEDSINLAVTTGILLTGGSEDNDTFSWKDDPYAEVLAKAYNGEITDLIYDQVRYPYEFIFCPSADANVTAAVHNLTTINRKCTRAHYFVTGTTNDIPATYQEARTARTEIPADSWKEDIIPEWARLTDPYMGRKVFMPSVYFTAYAIPKHWLSKKGKPLAGKLNATWSGFDVGTLIPASSNTNEYILNHDAGLNTMVEDGIGNASMYEQITAQANNSRLSEINNAQVLTNMVRIALRMANDQRWSDLGTEDITNYRKSVEDQINAELPNCFQTLNVIATRESENGAGRNRILCKINVLFKDMFKGVSYEFYILAQ